MRTLRLFACLAALGATTSGCYRYIPAAAGEVSPSQGIRVRLTAEEAIRYQDLRQADPRTLEGTLLERTGDALVLVTTVGSNNAETGARAFTQNVTVPLSSIVAIDRKQLDRTKTGLLVGGGLAVLTAVVLESRAGAGSPEPGGGGTAESRAIPLFRFSVPFR